MRRRSEGPSAPRALRPCRYRGRRGQGRRDPERHQRHRAASGDPDRGASPASRPLTFSSPDLPNYWRAAWAARAYLNARLPHELPRDAIGLAINAASRRSQDQLHIHIDCVAPDVRAALAAYDAKLTADWHVLPFALAGRAIGRAGSIPPISPMSRRSGCWPMAWRAPRSDMADETLVAIGATFAPAVPGFILLADHADPGGGGHGEDLLDARCAVAGAAPEHERLCGRGNQVQASCARHFAVAFVWKRALMAHAPKWRRACCVAGVPSCVCCFENCGCLCCASGHVQPRPGARQDRHRSVHPDHACRLGRRRKLRLADLLGQAGPSDAAGPLPPDRALSRSSIPPKYNNAPMPHSIFFLGAIRDPWRPMRSARSGARPRMAASDCRPPMRRRFTRRSKAQGAVISIVGAAPVRGSSIASRHSPSRRLRAGLCAAIACRSLKNGCAIPGRLSR